MTSASTTSATFDSNLWTWACRNVTAKPWSSEGHHVVLGAATVAYVLGTLASSVLSMALLALIIACAALVMSTVFVSLHQQRHEIVDGSSKVPSASVPDTVQEPCAFSVQRQLCSGARHNSSVQPKPVQHKSEAPLRVTSDANGQNSLIIHYSQEGNIEQAQKAIESMRAQGRKPKMVAYSCFLNACAKNVQVKQAEQCLQYMQEDSVKLNTICYSTVINVYASAGNVDKAEEFFCKMSTAGGDVEPSNSAYNALIKASAKARQIERAEKWFTNMKSAGIQPNVITFTTLINACAQCLDAVRAEKWLSAMSDHNVAANLMTHNSVINACAKVGDIERAEACFQRMKKGRISPDIVSYNSLINACAQAGNVERALLWLDTMIKDGFDPDNVTFSTCLCCWVKIGETNAAKQWLMMMLDRNVELNAVNYNTLIHTCVKAENFEFTEFLLHHVSYNHISIEPITYRAFIHALAKSNQSDRAMEWLEKMVQVHGMHLITADDMFGPVISSFCNYQNSDAILAWMKKMKNWNIPISNTVYTKTIKTLRQTGNNKQAHELCEDMNKKLHRS